LQNLFHWNRTRTNSIAFANILLSERQLEPLSDKTIKTDVSLLVSNSPLMSWAYSIFSVRTFSALVGITEIVIALLIAARPLSVGASVVGSALAVGMFLTTLSFLLTTPGVGEASAGGFPAISVVPGQFLIKDFVLLGASLWICGKDWRALTSSRSHQQQDRGARMWT
jgi:uncharacterized membrane protein YkgB